MLLSKTQRSLHQTTLELDDGLLEDASLFPLFDDEGRTRSLLLVSADSSQIHLLDRKAEIFARRIAGADRLRVAQSDLRDIGSEEAEAVSELWHWDPWWVLADERFAGHSAVPALRGTNIPGYDESWTEVLFHRSLSQLTWLATGKGEHRKMHRFRAEKLAAARERRAEEAPSSATRSWGGWGTRAESSSGWRLRDFSKRSCRPGS